jgi:hypothetical protein
VHLKKNVIAVLTFFVNRAFEISFCSSLLTPVMNFIIILIFPEVNIGVNLDLESKSGYLRYLLQIENLSTHTMVVGLYAKSCKDM